MLVLFCDTDCDLTPETAKKYGYHLISMPYNIGDETVYPYKESDTFDYTSYYNQLRDGVVPNTGAISSQQYIEYFEPYFKNGDDILYVHFSANMTKTFDVMEVALEELKARYPERKFYSVDTKAIVTLSYLIACEIGELYLQGKTAEEIVSWAENEVEHYAIYFFADNLKFFKHSGRVSGLAAFMGNMIGIRPIININSEGRMDSIGKERGKTNAMDRIIQYMVDTGDNLTKYKIVIGHTDSYDLALEMKELIVSKFGDNLDIDIVYCNSTCGAHCGPDAIGVAFHAHHR